MSRAQRLLTLIQTLRGHRFAVTGAFLAEKLGISLRTLYRDIKSLQEQGAPIEGGAGLGYILRPGFMLPPMMFTEEELEAIILGSRWVARRGDVRLGAAAEAALAKIAAVLPPSLHAVSQTTTLLVGPGAIPPDRGDILPEIRRAIRQERVVTIRYRDLQDVETTRTIWPFALGYFDETRLLAAWCTARVGFRHFRADRIMALDVSDARYPRRRQVLLTEWRMQEGIDTPDRN